ncbi:MAG: hypothetical protein J6I61_02495 [Prevotella sp.]|nr:hypothetical protein [Prevotella sp.]
MSDKTKILKTDNATIYQTNDNCQVFNGPISGCVFAMPGSTVNQTPVQQVKALGDQQQQSPDVIGEPLNLGIFDTRLFPTPERLEALRAAIGAAIGKGDKAKIDLCSHAEWYWLKRALMEAGVMEKPGNGEREVTDVAFVRQIALWFPEMVDGSDEKTIRRICKGMSEERGRWTMNGKPLRLTEVYCNQNRLSGMKKSKIERIISVAYEGVLKVLRAPTDSPRRGRAHAL